MKQEEVKRPSEERTKVTRLRLGFFGNPDFALGVLKGLEDKHDIELVVCSEDKRAGRGKKLSYCEVKEHALAKNYHLEQPVKLDRAFAEYLEGLNLDCAIVAAYGKLIPAYLLGIPKYGFINVHASLLPRWRGAAPIQRAIMAGDEKSGVCIMDMVEALDAGPVYLRRELTLAEDETAESLSAKLIELGNEALLEVLGGLAEGRYSPLAQSEEGLTYAKKIEKNEGLLDYTKTPEELCALIRGLNPYPAAKTYYKGDLWKIYEARPVVKAQGLAESIAPPGSIVSTDGGKIRVGCKGGFIDIGSLQRAGAKRMSSEDFLKGQRPELGTILSAVKEEPSVLPKEE